MLRAAVLAACVVAVAAPAGAGEVRVEFHDGYVTLTAREASVRQILQEWSRVGNTRLVNIDKVPGDQVTLELTRVPETQAIAVLLRSAAGYLAAPRHGGGGASHFAQIHLMPPSVAPPPQQPGTRALRRPPVFRQQPQLPQMLIDDQGNPVAPPGFGPPGDEAQPDPALVPQGPIDEGVQEGDEQPSMPQPTPYPGAQPYPGVQPYTPAAGDPPPPEPEDAGEVIEEPQIVEPGPSPGQGAVVAPAPGQLPAPAPQERRPRR